MAQGLAAATRGGDPPRRAAEYVLFTDADIAWAPTALRDLVRAAEDDDRALSRRWPCCARRRRGSG